MSQEKMLKPKALQEVLRQANTGGVAHTLLLTNDGTLLALAGENDQDARVTGAIAANVWHAFEREGKVAFDTDGLEFLILNCEKGRVAVTRTGGSLLLCLYALPSVELGLLKAKTEALRRHLDEPLRSVILA